MYPALLNCDFDICYTVSMQIEHCVYVEDIYGNGNGLDLILNGHNYLSVVLPCQILQFIGQ